MYAIFRDHPRVRSIADARAVLTRVAADCQAAQEGVDMGDGGRLYCGWDYDAHRATGWRWHPRLEPAGSYLSGGGYEVTDEEAARRLYRGRAAWSVLAASA